MKVSSIIEQKDLFKRFLIQQVDFSQKYVYENFQNFEYNWDLSELDLKAMFDKSLSSKISGRLWGGSKDSAKSMMMQFMDINKEFVRAMFRNLFDTTKETGMRINRFGFHCDQMLAELQAKDKKADVHFHEDRKMTAFYLAFQNPQEFTFFNYKAFKLTMQKLEAKSIPEQFEIERYFKLSNGLYKIISKDTELLDIHKQVIEPFNRNDPGQLILNDFYLFCAGLL